MLSENLQKAMNEQINKELFSEYIYLSMAAYFYSLDLDGFANWFTIQSKEENDHAMKFYYYVLERGGKVVLDKIEKPQSDFESIQEIFEITLQHEEFISKSINQLMDLSMKENDHASTSFLQWYVDEQVEEEANASKLLNKIKLNKDNQQGIFMLDAELAKRVYTPLLQQDNA